MHFSNKILSQTITKLCLDSGVDHIVISPGSRNASLIIGFTGQDAFTNFSIVDERCAAFFALGIAQQLQRPVALVCTSGSALLNYYPAIAEAYYSDIPLVVLSADRPQELIEIGDGQTIKQENVFANHILYNANCKEGVAFQTYNETEINTALHTAILKNGPVHINLPFSEPLYGVIDTPTLVPEKQLLPSIDISKAMIKAYVQEVLLHWNTAKKKMVLVGELPPDSLQNDIIELLAKDPSVLVLTETISNLNHPNFISAIDQLIAPLDEVSLENLQPEVLLTFGGLVVSKKIKAFLRTYQPKAHFHIDPKKAFDTYFCLTKHIPLAANTMLKEMLTVDEFVSSTYQENWLAVKSTRRIGHDAYVDAISYSDFLVFSIIFKMLPTTIQLQLGNSTTIRYAQLFDMSPTHQIFCNRGTSGIDGSTSTAIGAAFTSKLPTVFITGDLSFFYDSNALWNNYIPPNFKIIVINNSGGGIFRILPNAKKVTAFETYFETIHQLTSEHLCKMYGFEYQSVDNETSLTSAMKQLIASNETPQLLEIFTPSTNNDLILLEYFNQI